MEFHNRESIATDPMLLQFYGCLIFKESSSRAASRRARSGFGGCRAGFDFPPGFRGKIHSDSRQILQSLPIHTSKKLSLFFILIHASLLALSESLSNKIKLVTASLPMQMWTTYMYILTWFYKMLTSHGIFNICVWNSVVPSRFPNFFNLQIFTTVQWGAELYSIIRS